jgi:uncharacterized protein (TIGR00645 family)
MSTPTPEPTPTAVQRFEYRVEEFLFNARWFLAPIFIGLVVALVVILIKFFEEMGHLVTHVFSSTVTEVMLGILALLDLALLGNLVVIVILAGWENFVSKIHVAKGNEDRPSWMGHVDFSGLKMKLIGSIVAISVIGLLSDFSEYGTADEWNSEQQFWRIMLHITFLLSGIGFAFMDWLGEKRLQMSQRTHSGG